MHRSPIEFGFDVRDVFVVFVVVGQLVPPISLVEGQVDLVDGIAVKQRVVGRYKGSLGSNRKQGKGEDEE